MEESKKKSLSSSKWKSTEEFRTKLKLAETGDSGAMCDIGIICEENDSFAEAAHWFMRSAKKGNALSYFHLGSLLEKNKDRRVRNSEEKIVKYFGISAVLGCSYGQKKLADCYYDGKHGLDRNQSLAIDWYEYSAKQDNAEALYMLGEIKGDPRYYRKAADLGSSEAQYIVALNCDDETEKEKWLKLASNKGHLPATLLLAKVYEAHSTSDYNRKAYKLYGEVIKRNNSPEAAVRMADMLTYGVEGIDQNCKYAKELLEFAAQHQHPEALYKLGCMYWSGDGELLIGEDKDKAIALLKRAASLHHFGAAYSYGLICATNGNNSEAKKQLTVAAEGEKKATFALAKVCWKLGDIEEAIHWYAEAATIPNEEAQSTLGRIYCMGEGTQKNYRYSIHFYEMAPSCENSNSQYYIGYMYSNGGFGVSKDYEKAYYWFKKAAEQGHVDAFFEVGTALRAGLGTAKNISEALCWIEKAACADSLKAIECVGEMYANGEGTEREEPDFEKALLYDRLGVQKGSAISMNHLAYLYYYGQGVDKDFNDAFRLFSDSAQGDYLDSIKMLAHMCINGEGTERSVEDALKWYKKGAALNDADSAYAAANMYYKGEDVSSNYSEAVKYYEIAAKSAHLDACDAVGYMYLVGQGCTIDLDKACGYLRIAANAGKRRSQACLGKLYCITKEPSQAIVWYRKAAEQGDTESAFSLGEMYRLGEGTLPNNKEALMWYKKAADKGNSSAMEWTGYLYETGDGTDAGVPDYDKALDYYNQAITLNSFLAMERTAILFFNGSNLNRDYSEAFKLFSKAATEGNRIVSKRYLGYMYRDGKGTAVDPVIAFRWFENASEENDVLSIFEMAEMLRCGNGAPRDIERAFGLYEKAAQMGNVEACDWAGYMLVNGIGCEKDLSEARDYLSTASESGISRAQYYLSELLISVDKDYQQAIKLLTLSADAGLVEAECKLGEEYSVGRFISRDIKKAEPYLRNAIAKGSVRANVILGRNIWADMSRQNYQEAVNLFEYALSNDLEGKTFNRAEVLFYMAEAYRLGRGTAQEPKKALEYYMMSASLGNSAAMINLSNAYKEGVIVEKNRKMSRIWMENAAKAGNDYAIKKVNSVIYKLFG